MVRLLITSLVFFFGAQTFAADCGVFKVVKGKVTYKKKSTNNFRKASKNKKVCQGDTVKTADDGRTKIVMADKNEINVSPGSELIIETYQTGKKAVLNVINGKVRSDVKNKYKDSQASHYRVKTKSAVAGVRGTEFLASYNAATNQARVVTFEGEVAVGQMNGNNFVPQVTVKPGQFTSNSPGQDPHPAKQVPPSELAKMDRESKVAPTEATKAPASEQPKSEKEEDKPKDEGNKNEPKPKREGAKGPKGDGPAANKDGIAENGDGSDGVVGNGNPGEKAGADGSLAEDPLDPNAGISGGDETYREDDQYGEPKFDADADGATGDGQFGDGPDGGDLFNPDGSGGKRDVASIDIGGDDMGLPPPSLDDMPGAGDNGFIQPPSIPTLDPIINDIPQCLQCNDAVINQKVRVIIRPILPGSQ